MKLHLSILEQITDLPCKDPQELRKILDDLGLEVKGFESTGSDVVYNIETLANRGDHLSALGVGREFAARYLSEFRFPECGDDFSALKPGITIKNKTSLCSRIALLDADLDLLSLKPQISACLQGSVHTETPIVDLCAYLSLELGHPTHAFDYDKLQGDFIVTVLDKPEKIIALDGKEYTVPAGSIVGRDDQKICVVSGVIGCASSMVGPETRRVLVEAAVFDPVSIRKTARAMGISTDASYAFERGVDREMPLLALRRLVQLSAEGNKKGIKPRALSYFAGEAANERVINLSVNKVQKQFGLPDLKEEEIVKRLTALGYTASKAGEFLTVAVPSWRLWDVEKEEDLIEDLARVLSFSALSIDLPALDYHPPQAAMQERVVQACLNILHGLGFNEVITKSLYSYEEIEILEEADAGIKTSHVAIKNALEKSYSHLKVTNLVHLARLFERNLKRGISSFKVYENARLFRSDLAEQGYPYEQEFDVLSLAMGARVRAGEFRKAENIEENFYWFKGAIESALSGSGLKPDIKTGQNKLLHPGRQAIVSVNGTEIGFFGQMHPLLEEKLKLSMPLLYAELDLFRISGVAEAIKSSAVGYSDFPVVERDLTLKVGLRTLCSEVVAECQALRPESLKSIKVVDEFKRPAEDFRRVSYRFTFQSDSRTLTSQEIELQMKKIIDGLSLKSFNLAN